MDSILILSFVEWAGAFQRPHHLALRLAQRGVDVTYAAPGFIHRRRQRMNSGLDLPLRLTVLESPALPGGSRLAAVDAVNRALMRHTLGGKNPRGWDLIIFNDPRLAEIAAALPARMRVFDCMDDLSAMAGDASRWAQAEARALSVADRVWTGTAMLEERLRGHHARVRFIPCGVDGERFAHPDPSSVEAARAEVPPGDGPLAGYFGALNERFDAGLVRALVEESAWRVLLIGPATSRAPTLSFDSERLKWIGPRPYAQLPGFLAHMDLALIPYDTRGPHRYLYPVKALEYLAGGKPVLSTSLPDMVRFLGDYVELADGPEEWRRAGARLAADRESAILRARAGQAYALSRSWEAMVEEMLADLSTDNGLPNAVLNPTRGTASAESGIRTFETFEQQSALRHRELSDAPATIRVAHLLDGRHFGGAEQMVRRLVAASPSAGVDARVYCLSEGRLARFLRESGARLRVIPSSGRFDLRVVSSLIRAAREDGIQILQAHTSRTHLLARLASRRLGVPNVTTIHSPIALDENRSTRRHPARAWIERAGRRWTDQIVPVSREEADRLIRDEGVPTERLTWIPNGVEQVEEGAVATRRQGVRDWLARHGLQSSTFVITMIAQMRPRKGPEILLRAFARFRAGGGRGILLMIGDDEFIDSRGEYLAGLKRLAQTLDIDGVVFFTGFLEDPWELARGADLFALPSLFGEGLPLVLLEALNFGLPLAVSDCLGNREIALAAGAGWLHPAGDSEALADQLRAAASDRETLTRLGASGRRYFLQYYTLDGVTRAYSALYRRLLEGDK